MAESKRSAGVIPARLAEHFEQVTNSGSGGFFRDKDGGAAVYKKSPNGDLILYGYGCDVS